MTQQKLPHLQIARSEPVNDRRTRGGRGGGPPPDPSAHARKLREELEAERAREAEIAGFDPRRLVKLTLDGLRSDELAAIPGLSVVAEQGKNVTVLFASEEAVDEFNSRLAQLEANEKVTRQDILFAIQEFGHLTADDRTGPALRQRGWSGKATERMDVELWPLELANEREQLIANFERECKGRGIGIIDSVRNRAVVMFRVDVTVASLADLLNMRDVREVDYPPAYQIDFELLTVDLATIPTPTGPAQDAPKVAVLDSGLATAHPLLANAVGDCRGYAGDDDTGADTSGHGTHVAGLALYGDFDTGVREGLEAKVTLLAARIADAAGTEPTEFLENRIARAVREYKDEFGCRVFNLSFGDINRVYGGGHVAGLAATLDGLAREHQVLFVVSTGNFLGSESAPESWREGYPRYLLHDDARLLDPAPALNVLTVGGLARYEVPRPGLRDPDDPAYQPIAKRDEPFPLTRSGPGPCDAIKPELVDYAGNVYLDGRAPDNPMWAARELGELSANAQFAGGNLIVANYGTSYAAPKVAHLAARILAEWPDASANLLRALLVAHASVPEAAKDALNGNLDDILRVCGYGKPNEDASLFSLESRVTMYAEDSIPPNAHHFYELPFPDDLFAAPATRPRRIAVALSHMPRVRSTRLEYKENALSFRIVRAASLDEVSEAYRKQDPKDRRDAIGETDFQPGPIRRAGGTVQCASRTLRVMSDVQRQKRYFAVVTHSVPDWGQEIQEPYALVLALEGASEEVEVKLYSQVRAELEARVRERARASG